MIARAAEIERCCRALDADGMRLLTVTGRRGVGSSRVLRAIGVQPTRPVTLVDATRVSSRSDLVGAIGRSLGLTSINDESLIARLDATPSVLALDGVGAVDIAGSVVDDLLRGVDHLVVLASASAPLGVADEYAIRLTSLPLPGAGEVDGAAIAAAPAVALFLEQAGRTAPTFEPSPDDLVTIAEICRRLDGLPARPRTPRSPKPSTSPAVSARGVSCTVPASSTGVFPRPHGDRTSARRRSVS